MRTLGRVLDSVGPPLRVPISTRGVHRACRCATVIDVTATRLPCTERRLPGAAGVSAGLSATVGVNATVGVHVTVLNKGRVDGAAVVQVSDLAEDRPRWPIAHTTPPSPCVKGCTAMNGTWAAWFGSVETNGSARHTNHQGRPTSPLL